MDDKQILRGRDEFAKFEKSLILLAKAYNIFPFKMRRKLFEIHRFTRGKLGLGIRYALLKSMSYKCGKNVSIHPGTYIFNIQNLIIGNNVSIHPMCYIECGNIPGGVQIDQNVSIAHGTTIMATTHNYEDINIPIKDQGVENRSVHIHDNVWIGAKATITAGVSIESGCVIGANAVVTKNTEKNSVYVGVPAKKLKQR